MELTSAVASFSALAQPTRLRVVELLATHPDGLTAGEIARALEVPKNTMSAHLAILSHVGLVTSQRQGREISYQLARGSIETLIRQLNDLLGLKPRTRRK